MPKLSSNEADDLLLSIEFSEDSAMTSEVNGSALGLVAVVPQEVTMSGEAEMVMVRFRS